jgi:ABC-type multidrug transport system fused ATPase/permease subunit
VRVIRAFHKEEEEKVNYETATTFLYRIQMSVGRIAALLNPLTYVIVNLALAVILWVGGNEVYTGRLTQGSVIALVNYMSQILVELVKFANLIVMVNRGIACAGRLSDILEVKSSIVETSTANKVDLATTSKSDKVNLTALSKSDSDKIDLKKNSDVLFSHVSFTYQGAGAETLSDIHFHAKTGQTIGIIGGTGCGKTSLVNLIPRFYDASKGQVLIGGRDVKDYPLEELREQIGVVPQKAVLFKGSLKKNMQIGNQSATDEEIWKALEIAQAKEFVEGTGKGLDYFITQNGQNLSGGQKQRLTIARALVKHPAILILDDSASALDFATDAKLRRALAENLRQTTVFLVSQRASTIRQADQILVLDDGCLVGCGRHDELYETCPLYHEICQSQEGAGTDEK